MAHEQIEAQCHDLQKINDQKYRWKNMIENERIVYENFQEIPIEKYWKIKKNFGAILNISNPNDMLYSNLGRAQIGDMIRAQVARYFVGKARGKYGYIGGGNVLTLRRYVLAWNTWIDNWPVRKYQHREEFKKILDELCRNYDID